MGRRAKYTAAELREQVVRYFFSISQETMLMKAVATGATDDYGHAVYEQVPDLNKLGLPVFVTRFLSPPTVGGLCGFLGIHRSTWVEYCDAKLNPKFADATQLAREWLLSWREEQLFTREGKDVRGVIFDLQANYSGFGYAFRGGFGPAAGRHAPAGDPGASGAPGAGPVPIGEREALLKELAGLYAGAASGAGGAARADDAAAGGGGS